MQNKHKNFNIMQHKEKIKSIIKNKTKPYIKFKILKVCHINRRQGIYAFKKGINIVIYSNCALFMNTKNMLYLEKKIIYKINV